MTIPWYKKAKAELKARKLRQEDVAEVCGVTTAAINHWLNGRRNPRIDDIRTIAGLLRMSVSELVGEDAYFLLDEKERQAIDMFREIPADDREKALKILQTLREYPKDESSKK